MKRGQIVGPLEHTLDRRDVEAFRFGPDWNSEPASLQNPIVLGAVMLYDVMSALMGGGGEDEASRLRHVEQEISLFNVIPTGVPFQLTAEVTDVGRYGSGEAVEIVANVAADSYPLARLRTIVLTMGVHSTRELRCGRLRMRSNGAQRIGFGERIVDEGTVGRYAAASGDNNRIHLDDDAARAAGFPGRIAHGMCTLALILESARGLRFLDGWPPPSVAVRFVAPVPVGSHLSTEFYDHSGRYGFSTSVRSSPSSPPSVAAIGFVGPAQGPC